jgi:decaprenyl-phosphate phosphoribosyltransferase
MKRILELIRIKHWVKNLFIFIPGFFAGVLFDFENLKILIASFFCFSLVASAIYIVNDYKDIESDRNHPLKKSRPLASGLVSLPVAFAVSISFIILGLAIAYFVDLYFFYVIVIYLGINIGYSFGLKNISILDIMLVASGFLLRTIAGGIIIHVFISKWLLIMVYLLALFMAMAKRLDDFLVAESEGTVSRKTVKNYNLNFIYSGITMLSAIISVSYLMYTISDDVMIRMHTEHLYVTSIFVIAGILRYLQITLVENNSGSPTKILLNDKFIFFTLVGWVLSFVILIYL